MMRALLLLAAMAGLAACGQTGALYLPDESVKTPVEIRGPGEPTPADDQDKDKKDAQPTPPAT